MNSMMNKKIKIFLYFWLPVLLYSVLIYSLSSNQNTAFISQFFFIDKLIHFLVYAFLGLLVVRAFTTLRFQGNMFWLILISILLSTLYGVSDEIHQYFVPSRHVDVKDICADLLGSAFGVFLYYFLCIKERGLNKLPD